MEMKATTAQISSVESSNDLYYSLLLYSSPCCTHSLAQTIAIITFIGAFVVNLCGFSHCLIFNHSAVIWYKTADHH